MNKSRSAVIGHRRETQKRFEKTCRKHGMRITPQRVAIYNELCSSKDHPSAAAIYTRVRKYYPNISLGTVNTTLLTFARIGLVKVVESSGDPKRFDPDLNQHHHFKCVKCGRIFDFTERSYDKITVPAEISRKYVVTGKKVHLEGFCDRCKANNRSLKYPFAAGEADSS